LFGGLLASFFGEARLRRLSGPGHSLVGVGLGAALIPGGDAGSSSRRGAVRSGHGGCRNSVRSTPSALRACGKNDPGEDGIFGAIGGLKDAGFDFDGMKQAAAGKLGQTFEQAERASRDFDLNSTAERARLAVDAARRAAENLTVDGALEKARLQAGDVDFDDAFQKVQLAGEAAKGATEQLRLDKVLTEATLAAQRAKTAADKLNIEKALAEWELAATELDLDAALVDAQSAARELGLDSAVKEAGGMIGGARRYALLQAVRKLPPKTTLRIVARCVYRLGIRYGGGLRSKARNVRRLLFLVFGNMKRHPEKLAPRKEDLIVIATILDELSKLVDMNGDGQLGAEDLGILLGSARRVAANEFGKGAKVALQGVTEMVNSTDVDRLRDFAGTTLEKATAAVRGAPEKDDVGSKKHS